MEGNWRGGPPGGPRWVAVCRAAGWCALVLAGASTSGIPVAHAAGESKIVGFIGGAGGTQGGQFLEPSDVAVYRGEEADPFDDKVFVSEAAAGRSVRVQRLDAHGNFELMWGRDVVRAGARGDNGAGFEICRRAVSGAAGCKAGAPSGHAGELALPMGLAVSEATGHVYVVDQDNRRVQQHHGNGRFIRAWGWGVASGKARLEGCQASCRPGRIGGRGGDANPGQIAAPPRMWSGRATTSIAVSPSPPHDVFVGDTGNRRVQQFTAAGGFVRAWGWGVATGGHAFEVCTVASGCRRGRRRGHPFGLVASGWPRYVTVDGHGVVYSAELRENDRIVRFATEPPLSGPNAADALLSPLRPGRALSGGETTGLALDPRSGALVAVRNPFGPSIVNVVSNPGAGPHTPDRPAPRAQIEELGYLQSVHGVGVGGQGVVYVPISRRLDSRDPDGVLSSCVAAGGPRPCHGLAVFAPDQPPAATVTQAAVIPNRRSATIQAEIGPGGISRYRLQASVDGRRWRAISPSRYATGIAATRLRLSTGSLRRGTAYRIRLQVATHDGDRYRWSAASNALTLVTPALRIGALARVSENLCRHDRTGASCQRRTLRTGSKGPLARLSRTVSP